MKSEANRRKRYESWAVPFMDINRLAAAGFYFKNGVISSVVHSAESKWIAGSPEMIRSRTISAGVHLAGSLRGWA
jgi:hypothetical protein